MIDDREHPADAPEQEITSETPEFAAELAARTIEPSAKRDAAEKQSVADSSSVTETGPEAGADAGTEAERAEPEHEEAAEAPQPKLERLQKILAQAGVASRRHAEELITAGRVEVNGQTVTVLGSKADPERDHIRVDGKLLHGAERLRYFVLNKPKGFVTTVTDPEGRPTVMQFFAKTGERLYPVGRLDYQSEGLLLVTNDGELANQLTRAASRVEKTYLVKVAGQPGEEELERLRGGVAIDKGSAGEGKVHTAPARIRQVRQGDNPWYEVVLIEGRNRELRKMFEEIGHHVEKIRRVGYGPLVLDVEPGKIRELATEEVQALRLTAAGKWKPRRPKASLMLPKEAGQSTEQRMAKDAARREKKFKRPYARDSRRDDIGARPPQRSAGAKSAFRPEFRPESRTGPEAGNRPASGPAFRPDIRRPSREGARPSPGRSGGRFNAKPAFDNRPPRAEGKFRSDRSQSEAKPGFDRRPPSDSGAGFRSEGSQRRTGRPSDRPAGSRPGSDRRSGFDPKRGLDRTDRNPGARPEHRPGNRPDHRADRRPDNRAQNRPDDRQGGRRASRAASRPGAGGFDRPGPSRPRLEIRAVEPGEAFDRDRPRTESGSGPRTGPRSGPGTRPIRTGPRTDGPPRGRDSAGEFRSAGRGRPQGGSGKPDFSGRPNKPAFGARPQGAGSSSARFKKKDGAPVSRRSSPNRSSPNRSGSKSSGPKKGSSRGSKPGGKRPGGKRKDGGKRNFGKRAK